MVYGFNVIVTNGIWSITYGWFFLDWLMTRPCVWQMLLGMYRCTDIPGKFVWQPGTLTQAVTKGHWILLEDIDHAPLDVVSSTKHSKITMLTLLSFSKYENVNLLQCHMETAFPHKFSFSNCLFHSIELLRDIVMFLVNQLTVFFFCFFLRYLFSCH